MKTFFAVLAAGAIIFAAFVGSYADNRKVRIQSGLPLHPRPRLTPLHPLQMTPLHPPMHAYSDTHAQS